MFDVFRVGVCHGCTVSARGAFPSPAAGGPEPAAHGGVACCETARRTAARFAAACAARHPERRQNRARRFGTANIVRFLDFIVRKANFGAHTMKISARHILRGCCWRRRAAFRRSSRAGACPSAAQAGAWLLFGGDVMQHLPQVTAARRETGFDYREVFAHLHRRFRAADW